MLVLKKNPFNWEMSSSAVRSSVTDFSLKNTKGKPLNVSGLQTPIELNLPIKAHNEDKKVTRKFFIKPSEDFENMRYHEIHIASPQVTVFLHIKPTGNKTLEVYVGHEKRPNPKIKTGYFNKTIPDYSSCLNYSHHGGISNCTSDPNLLVLTSHITGTIGKHYVGIRYRKEPNETTLKTLEIIRVLARERRNGANVDCTSHNGRTKRSCIGVKPAPTTPPPTPKDVIPLFNDSVDVNYTFTSSVASCVYWEDDREIWTSEGCEVRGTCFLCMHHFIDHLL